MRAGALLLLGPVLLAPLASAAGRGGASGLPVGRPGELPVGRPGELGRRPGGLGRRAEPADGSSPPLYPSSNSSSSLSPDKSTTGRNASSPPANGPSKLPDPASPHPLANSSTTSPPSLSPSLPPGPVVTITVGCPGGNSSLESCPAPPPGTTHDKPEPWMNCTALPDDGRPMTHFSVIYTSTVTFFGNKTDYTPPFKPLVTPKFCAPPMMPAAPLPTGVTSQPPPANLIASTGRQGLGWMAGPIVTFITTDKNPSVVFPSDPVPRYTPTWGQALGGQPGSAHHNTADNIGSRDHGPVGGGRGPRVGPHPNPEPDGVHREAQHGFGITARGFEVIINDQTYSDLGPRKTSTVTVGAGTFTIYPTAVVGQGATVLKPAPAATGVSVATPTSGVVGGLPVILTEARAVVGGATLAIPEGSTTTLIDGRRVSIGPGALVVGPETLSFRRATPGGETDVLVNGGELVTAIGRSVIVIHSKTLTYGPGIPAVTEVINADTISIGPSGVLVNGMLMGGPSADAKATGYEILGGATILRIAPSIAIINGVTFTVGPGTHWTTTVIAGQTFNIGPTGVVVSAMTLKYPFGSAATTTIVPSGTWLPDVPVETAGAQDDEENSTAGLPRPDALVRWTVACIAIGVWVWV